MCNGLRGNKSIGVQFIRNTDRVPPWLSPGLSPWLCKAEPREGDNQGGVQIELSIEISLPVVI